MEDKVQLIKEEIERLIERAQAERVLYPKTILASKNLLLIEDYNRLLGFIDSLPEEPTIKGITWEDVNTLENLINQVHYEFPYGIGEKSFGLAVLEKFQDCQDSLPEELASEDLEEELHNFLFEHGPMATLERCAKHFAEWQKNKMKEALQTEYEKGRSDKQQEMMKDAQDAIVVVGSDKKLYAVPILIKLDEEIRNKKKVKLVIIDINEQD